MTDKIQTSDGSDEERDLSFRRRVLIIAGVGMFFIFLILAQLINVQIVKFEEYRTLSDENRIRVKAISPTRGFFFDRDGEILADTKFILTLLIDEERAGDLDKTIANLGDILELTDHHLEQFEKARAVRTRLFRPVPLKRNLTQEESAKIALNRHRLPGVIVAIESIRNYPHGELTAHALGAVRRITEEDLSTLDSTRYSGSDFVGGTAVEMFYETDLHGEPGHRIVEVDAHHRELRVLNETAPIHGKDIFLHLDLDIQRAAWDALGERRGAVVAIEPQSGGILALVSKPSYDPNLFVQGITTEQFADLQDPIQTPLFNRAVRATYAPGSTFKPIAALAGIVNDITDWERIIVDRGTFRLQLTPSRQVWRDWSWSKNNPGGQGECDLHRAIYRSSNIYFYTIAEEMGVLALTDFARQFGYGRNHAYDIPDAADGLLPDPDWKQERTGEPWRPGDTVNLGIGQGSMLVTPLQVADVAATIARGGTRVQPRLIMYSPKDVYADRPPPEKLPPVQGLLPEDWMRLREAMVAVVHRGNMGYGNNGTAWAYIGMSVPYEIAGKSGTVQTIAIPPGEEYEEEEIPEQYRDNAWFMAFAPALDPEIAVVALVENGGGGSAVAGPVVRQVLDTYMSLNVEPETAFIESDSAQSEDHES